MSKVAARTKSSKSTPAKSTPAKEANWPGVQPETKGHDQETRRISAEIMTLTGWDMDQVAVESLWRLHEAVRGYYDRGAKLAPSAVVTPAPNTTTRQPHWPAPVEGHNATNRRETEDALVEVMRATGWSREDALAEAIWKLHGLVPALGSREYGAAGACMTPRPKLLACR